MQVCKTKMVDESNKKNKELWDTRAASGDRFRLYGGVTHALRISLSSKGYYNVK